ncbi:MAG: hypothetical protein ACK4M3_05210 [Pyrobaculum sp.]
MLKTLERLVELSRSRGLRFVLHFAKCRGKVGIDREIKALDEEGRPASWPKVFPGVTPQNILSQCVLKKVEVYWGSELIGEFKTLEEMFSYLRA